MGWASFLEDIDKRANYEYKELTSKRTKLDPAKSEASIEQKIIALKQAGKYLEMVELVVTVMQKKINSKLLTVPKLREQYCKQTYKNDSLEYLLNDTIKYFINDEIVRTQLMQQVRQYFLQDITYYESLRERPHFRKALYNEPYSTYLVTEKECELLILKLLWLNNFLAYLNL